MNKRKFCIICFCVIQIIGYAAELQIPEKYSIHDGKNIVYLEMEVSEVEHILGVPDDIEINRLNDPLHNYDIVSWIYEGIQISFYDVAAYNKDVNIVTKIAIPKGSRGFMFGSIVPSKSTIEEVEKIYGKPDYISEKDSNIYYQYDVTFSKKYLYTYTVQFCFNSDGICNEIIFLRDDF